jgi:hypothetical protein
MALPEPEPGLVINYAYLWHHEHEAGQEEGRKDRPSVIVLSVEGRHGATVVTVLPITHVGPRLAPGWPTRASRYPQPSSAISVSTMHHPGFSSRKVTSLSGRATICASGAAAATGTASCRPACSTASSRRLSIGISSTAGAWFRETDLAPTSVWGLHRREAPPLRVASPRVGWRAKRASGLDEGGQKCNVGRWEYLQEE